MRVKKMKKSDFDAIPVWEPWTENTQPEPFYSMVIIPTHKYHDSGFKIMDFVFCNKDQEPICRLNGGSDVIHIDGIDGKGLNRKPTDPPEEWSIDCLPCGYLRIFCRGTITCGYPVSDFEIYWKNFL